MKNFDGIVPPTFVRADEGKKGLDGPPPSSFMVSGVVSGLTMVWLARHRACAIGLTMAGTATASTSNDAPAVARRRA